MKHYRRREAERLVDAATCLIATKLESAAAVERKDYLRQTARATEAAWRSGDLRATTILALAAIATLADSDRADAAADALADVLRAPAVARPRFNRRSPLPAASAN